MQREREKERGREKERRLLLLAQSTYRCTMRGKRDLAQWGWSLLIWTSASQMLVSFIHNPRWWYPRQHLPMKDLPTFLIQKWLQPFCPLGNIKKAMSFEVQEFPELLVLLEKEKNEKKEINWEDQTHEGVKSNGFWFSLWNIKAVPFESLFHPPW